MNNRWIWLYMAIGILVTTKLANAGESTTQTVQIKNLSLDEAVEIALRQNRDILKAKQEIERNRGLIIEIRAHAFPHIILTSTYNQQDKNLLENASRQSSQIGQQSNDSDDATTSQTTSQSTENQTDESEVQQSSSRGGSGQDKSWRIAIEGRQALYSGGQFKASLNIAKFNKENSFYTLRDTVDRVISQVKQQFYEVLLNKALITVQEESIQLLASELENQQNRFEAGTVPHFNVLRAEVELANARPELIRARNNYRIAQLNLSRTLAFVHETESPKATFNVVGKLDVKKRSLELVEALALAKVRRAFLKVQRQSILIEVEQIKIAISGYKPRLEARGGYEVRNSRLSKELDDTVHGWFFGLTGTWNIFDGFETYGKLKQARARLESARISYEDSVQQVEVEVQEAYAQIQQAKELIQSQLKTVTQASEALRLARERLAAGAGTQLDVLDARVALTRARVTELQARYDYNVALAQLDRATGADTEYAETFDDPLTIRTIKLKNQGLRIESSK